jgi:DNA helicase HerA-like ATPase
MEELWRQRGLAPIGDAYQAFLTTATWTLGVLQRAFETVGSTPSAHWSDLFLSHWSATLRSLDLWLASLGATPLPRHAWDVLRAAGLPVPGGLVLPGNPFLDPPKSDKLTDSEGRRLAADWQDIVDSFIVPEGAHATLLTALDRLMPGASQTTPWRGLNWQLPAQVGYEPAAPVIGQALFASAVGLLSATPPSMPPPVGAWWGVSTTELQKAAADLRGPSPVQPASMCATLVPLAPTAARAYLLQTRAGAPVPAHTAKKWKVTVTVPGVSLIFREQWKRLFVSIGAPAGPLQDGDAWIDPSSVEVSIKGRDIRATQMAASPGAGDQLAIQCMIEVDYSCNREPAGSSLSGGTWTVPRTLSLKVKVKDRVGGVWGPSRPVESSFTLLVPSPYALTIVVGRAGKPIVSPDNGDEFGTQPAQPSEWVPGATPDVLLREEGTYDVTVYDGRIDPATGQFAAVTPPLLNGQPLPVAPGFPELFSLQQALDQGHTFGSSGTAGTSDVAVVRVEERSKGSLSSGLLAAVRRQQSGRRQPSAEARSTLLGSYQTHVLPAVQAPPAPGRRSLYQYVVSSSETAVQWRPHTGGLDAERLFTSVGGAGLPAIGSGPTAQLAGTPEWAEFMARIGQVSQAAGIATGGADFWLSGFNPRGIPPELIRAYVEAHRQLVVRAKGLSPRDTFWACYPFSVVVVEGQQGAVFGQVQAVLLSPLHPARLTWAFALATVAGNGDVPPALLGLAEGWNVPYTGPAVNPAGQYVPMVAVPLDPGNEQDFAAWSALAVLSTAGLASLPSLAAGLPMPWGGKTGINEAVVERAITDYLAVHPHLSGLEVDIRSVDRAPRSREIDDAVLKLVGTSELQQVDRLGGGVRVWDSSFRLGSPPTRDKLFQLRGTNDRSTPFEWRRYDPAQPPTSSDVALVENSSVHLAFDTGSTTGVTGPLLLRRFSPPTLQQLTLDQHYSLQAGEDVLGLASLLAEIEYRPQGQGHAVLRATPQQNALGIGLGARWEVLGTFNIDPALLASVVSASSHGSGIRQLWEWRPSWLDTDKGDELARRPYYVVAKIPPSLLKALEFKQGFTAAQAGEMLSELGRRGIGLASLHAKGGTQEAAAAGLFFASTLLLPTPQHSLPAAWLGGGPAGSIRSIVPLDPVETILEGVADEELARRADLLAVSITRDQGTTHICLLPVEVKHHGLPGTPEDLPKDSDAELNRARAQLAQTSRVLRQIAPAIAAASGAQAFTRYARRLGLATLVDLALSFAPTPPAAADRAQVLRDVLSGQVTVGCGEGVLLWFAPGLVTLAGSAGLLNPHGAKHPDGQPIQELFIDPSATPTLWWRGLGAGADETHVRQAADLALGAALSPCAAGSPTPAGDLREEIDQATGGIPLAGQGKAGESAPDEGGPAEPASGTEADEDPGAGDAAPPVGEMTIAPPNARADGEAGDAGEGRPSAAQPGGATAGPTPAADAHAEPAPVRPPDHPVPKLFLGWSGITRRWTLLGKLAGTGEPVGMDLDHPKTVGIFGYMGSGKSYLLGTLIESALQPIPGINDLPAPLSVVIFNYRRNAADRFELNSLAAPNRDEADVARLATDYGAVPAASRDVHVLCLPGELSRLRRTEYGPVQASELYFSPEHLTVEDWELLMGEPGSEAVFARTIRHALMELRATADLSLERLEESVCNRLARQSRAAAELRFDFVRNYLSKERGTDFGELLRPGRAVVIDLRQPLFNKDDALRFFLVCASHVSRVQGNFNKVLVFDEAHEYMSAEFGERLDARIRQMRHEGTSYVFATQDVGSIPLQVRRFLSTRFVFGLGTRENIDDLVRFAPEFRGIRLESLAPGTCYVQASPSVGGVFQVPRLVNVRPRVTQHGGASRIFSGDAETGGS